MLLQLGADSVGGYADTVAYAVGALFVLAAVGYRLVTRGAGRQGDERSHEKAVSKALDRRFRRTELTRTRQAAVDRDEPGALLSQLDRLLGMDTTVARCIPFDLKTIGADADAGAVPQLQDYLPDRRVTRVRQWLRRRNPGLLTAHALTFQDADGQPLWVVSVNGRRLAHRDREALLADVETVAKALSEYETPAATVSEYYYGDIREGRVDIAASRARLRGDVKTRIQANLRREETLPRGKLVERLVYDRGFRYPRAVVESKLAELVGRDIREYKDGTLEWQRY
jgi:hypothetical protein